jgi:glycerol uptake facilitator-like aquaporin
VYGCLPWSKVPGFVGSQFLGVFTIHVLDYQRLMKADPDKETMHHNL